MQYLKSKSDFNVLGAEVLIEKSLFAPSVHCSYYAVLQLLKYSYIVLSKISSKELSEKIIADRRNSHTFLLDEFCITLQHTSKYEFTAIDVRNLKNDVKDLKQFRNDSDYENIEIDYSLSNKAFSLSKSILDRIKNIR